MDEGLMLLLVGAVLAASVVVALGAARTGLPVLVAFLGLGMLLGSDGPGGIEFDDAELARQVGIVGLALILYEGGLQTSWRRLRQRRGTGGAAQHGRRRRERRSHRGRRAYVLFDLSLARGDPARRRRRVHRCGRRLRDAPLHAHPPAGGAHARGRVGRKRPDGDRAHAWADRLDRASRRLRVRRPGAPRRPPARSRTRRRCLARRGGRVALRPTASLRSERLRRSRRSPRGCVSFGAADVIGGSGFLAVYLVGLAVGSTPSRYRRQLVAFHEGLAFVAQVVLFIVLGLLVFPRQLPDVAAAGLGSGPAPRARDPACSRSGPRPRSATSPPASGCCSDGPAFAGPYRSCSRPSSSPPTFLTPNTIFNAVFFVVVVSAIVQGTTLERFAREAPSPLAVAAYAARLRSRWAR